MRVAVTILPLAAVAAAIVVPDEHVFAQLPLEDTTSPDKGVWYKLPSLEKWAGRLRKPFKHVTESIGHPLDDALSKAKHDCNHEDKQQTPFDFSWIEDELQSLEEGPPQPPHRPHWPPPHRGPSPPHHPPGRGPPGKRPGKKPGKRPHKRPGWKWPHHHKHHKPNHTIYELISKSNFTKNLTALIDENKDIVKMLNSTKANYTIFAPTDWAFRRIHKHLEKVPKEIVTKVLLYHIIPDLYPSFKLVWTHTAPTALEGSQLGGHPQRLLAKWFGFIRGLRINYYDRVIAANIPATNGIIHATSAILLPPPPGLAIITHLPGSFSTFELGLTRTGLIDTLNTTGKDTVGGTLFAPTNLAFKKLGPRANAFLFSKFGAKFLKALLSYHVVPDRTLYSTAFYDGEKKSTQEFFAKEVLKKHHQCHKDDKEVKAATYVHIDLPTLLEKPVAVDIIRRGPFVEIKVNAFVRVAVQDVLAKDGVIQVLNNLIIPPKKPGAAGAEESAYWNGEDEMEVAELKERLLPYVEEEDLAQQEQEGMKLDL